MMYDLARETRRHLAIKNEKAPVSCIRKQCACGKQVTAKQLVQYKMCVTCVKAAA